MGKTSSAVKDRYNAKTYDEIKVRVDKGQKEKLKAYAAASGKSLNRFIMDAVEREISKQG